MQLNRLNQSHLHQSFQSNPNPFPQIQSQQKPISSIPPNPIKTLTKNTTMSRSLSQTLTLTRISTARYTVAVAARRHHSNLPEIGVAKTKEEMERAALKKLEDAIHRMIIKKSQPDWLPLVPGGSYWVPPKKEARDFAQVVATLVKDSTSVKEFMRNDVSSNSHRGLPFSAQFFKGPSDSSLEEEMNFKNSNQSEEDEG